MSYCRFSEGDVYLIPTEGEPYGITTEWCCMGCLLREGDSVDFFRAFDVLEHLEEHRQAGHSVPDRAFDRLQSQLGMEEKSL